PLLGVDAAVRLGPTQDRREPLSIAAGDLLSLELPARPSVAPTATVLEFANGDRVAAEVGLSEEDAVAARIGDSMLRVPLETLRGIAFRPLDPDDGSAAIFFREAGADDLVLLTNGDRLVGQMLGLSEAELTLDAAGREVRIPRDRIAAVAFSPELTSPAGVDGPRQIVHTAAGRLTVRGLARADDGSWRAETAFGEPVAWPADAVRRVQFAGGRTVFLSDLEPSQVEIVPFLDRVWPVRIDRAVTGEPLTAGGVSYAKGLGVHSRCRITYDLGGEYEALHAVAGLAESAGEIGSVEFAIEIDGREVVRTGPVARSGDPVRITHLDLRGAEALVLTVDFGRNGDVRDRANWCDAVLVRTP
ncbi:MAG TPA: NPCBM/NEW2 domain-containing protein, partial [Planctomycetaceae bacterium]